MLPSTIREALVADGTPEGARPAVRPRSSRPSRPRRPVAALLAGLLLLITACGGDPAATTEATDPANGDVTTAAEPAATTDPDVPRPEPDSDDAAALAAGINEVGYELFRAEAAASEQDVLLSPLSIGLAFGMLDVGATGATAEALEELFAYPVAGEVRWSAFNTLDQRVVAPGEASDGPNMVVRLANRQFPDESFEPVEGYDETIARFFGAGIEPLPLQADPEAARDRINGWVSDRTEGHIPDLLPESSPEPNAKLVLVNALYFEANWYSEFEAMFTTDADFTLLDGSIVQVPTMRSFWLDGPVSITDDYEAVVVSYADPAYQLLLVVPTRGDYAEVEATFDGELIDAIDGEMRQAEHVPVVVHLPRFDSETTLPLRERLEQDLDVTGLFEQPGGLNGIHQDVVLGNAFHAATIEVDEEGTIATAATALEEVEGAEPEPAEPIEIHVDRPFLYLIRHRPTGANLFVGRVLDPAA
jgi:serpin B